MTESKTLGYRVPHVHSKTMIARARYQTATAESAGFRLLVEIQRVSLAACRFGSCEKHATNFIPVNAYPWYLMAAKKRL